MSANQRETENTERRIVMKKCRIAAFVAGIVVLILVFCPYSTSNVISGDAEILNLEDEKIGESTLSVEIFETRSLLFRYKKQFSYTLNGEDHKTFVTSSHSETDDGVCLVSQMYYDEKTDSLNICSLIYSNDFSYATLRLGEEQYMISSR